MQVPDLTAEDVADFIEAIDINRDGLVDYKEYMAMLQPQHDIVIGDETNSTESPESLVDQQQLDEEDSRQIIPKVEPYGSEEIREVIIRRKQKEQEYIREERLRRQAYAEALDVKVSHKISDTNYVSREINSVKYRCLKRSSRRVN